VAALHDLATQINEGDATRIVTSQAFGTLSELMTMAKILPLTGPYTAVDSINELVAPTTTTTQRVISPDTSAWGVPPTTPTQVQRIPPVAITLPKPVPAPPVEQRSILQVSEPPTLPTPIDNPATVPAAPATSNAAPTPSSPTHATRRSERTRVAAKKYAALAASNEEFYKSFDSTNPTLDPERPLSKGGITRIHRTMCCHLAPLAVAVAMFASTPISADPVYTYALPDQHGDLSHGAAMKSPHRAQYEQALVEELERCMGEFQTLFQVDTIPEGCPAHDWSYDNPRFRTKTTGSNTTTYHCRLTYSGKNRPSGDETFQPTAQLEDVKMFLQSVVSDQANISAIDIKAYFLNTPLTKYKYLRLGYKHIPDAILKKYNWYRFQEKGYIWFEIRRAMYGMDDAARKSFLLITQRLREAGYMSTERNPTIFRNSVTGVAFTLVVDDLAVKWKNRKDFQHLLDTLRQSYTIKVEERLTHYIGLTIDYPVSKNYLAISMPGYADNMVNVLNIQQPKFVATPAITPVFNPNSKVQRAEQDNSPPCPDKTRWVQQAIGLANYFARGVNYSIKTAINKIALEQSAPTANTIIKTLRLLHYIYYHRNPVIRFYPQHMQIQSHSDASYLSEPKARSRYSYVVWIGDPVSQHANFYVPGIIQYETGIIRNVVTSVAEAEYTALFLATMAVIKARNFLEDLGYTQNRTTIYVDNKCAQGLANRSCKDKHLKHIDMRLHFTRDKIDSAEIAVDYVPTKDNLADFGTKNMDKDTFNHKNMNFLFSNPSYLKGELETYWCTLQGSGDT
jgi:hypothetical protein